MKKTLAVVAMLLLGSCNSTNRTDSPEETIPKRSNHLELGAFSVSLAVADIAASRDFYEKLGFNKVAGNQEQNWLVLQNGDSTIGLFQGMFEKNTLTFNPGWNSKKENLSEFTDVREIQRQLKKLGIELVSEADESTSA